MYCISVYIGMIYLGNKLGNKPIKTVSSFKYLGFHLGSTLTHIADVIRKIVHKRTVLARVIPFLNTGVAILIYKTMILPYFDYCDIVYHGAGSGELEKLQRLQNKWAIISCTIPPQRIV